MIYNSPLNKGCYLHYDLVVVIGTLLAILLMRFVINCILIE